MRSRLNLEHAQWGAVGSLMVGRILIELETPNDSRSMFRLIVDEAVVGETLTAAHAHILVGEILDRASSRCGEAVAVPLSVVGSQAAATASRQVRIAAVRRTRCVRAETRWRWVLKVL